MHWAQSHAEERKIGTGRTTILPARWVLADRIRSSGMSVGPARRGFVAEQGSEHET